MYPAGPFTKADLIAYALEISPFILPYMANRPLTLIRYPDGVGGKTFYTKNKPSWTPDWIPTTVLPWDSDKEYVFAQNTAHLVWLTNLAALEIHIMNSTTQSLLVPDQFVIDLDPPIGQDYEDVKQLAFKLKTFLEGYGYFPMPKLSGGKGIHLVVPIQKIYDYDTVIASVKALMQEFMKANKDTTLFVHKDKRKGKTLLDIYRNHPGNTTIAPYSTRGKTGAPVSMPLRWAELEKTKSAQDYNIKDCLAYLNKNGDAWQGLFLKATVLHDQQTQVAITSLQEYQDKRNFNKTAEPTSTENNFDPNSVNGKFTVQLHHATNLHYDLRLGENGVLKSWAIPKGLPIESGIKRLAIQTEDHPAKYLTFEGIIPKEEYGGGQMWVFETGTFQYLKKTDKSLKIKLKSPQIDATFSLYKTKGNEWIIERAASAYLDMFTNGIKPMLSDVSPKLPKSLSKYQFEIKWDGIRALYYKRKNEVKLLSRSGRNLLDQFPEFKDPKFIRAQNAIIDCELVCLDPDGKPVFADIISRMHRLGERNIASGTKTKPAYMYAFDCLYLDGKKLINEPLTRRREWLETILKTGNSVRISQTFENGAQIYEAAKNMGLEGIMAKKKDGKYYPGDRSNAWQKIKFRNTFEGFIIGYTKGNGDRADLFGSLHLANEENQQWVYYGKVGTGFTMDSMKEILSQLKEVPESKKYIADTVEQESDTIWIEPVYLCEVSYASLSSNNTLREPVFLKMWK